MKNLQTTVVIQARQGSTRLPRKTLKKVLGKPLLDYLIERINRAKTINRIVVATTTQPEDDEIESFCLERGLLYYRGSKDDVLGRFLNAAQIFSADPIVRITADCPLIDPIEIDRVVNAYLQHDPKVDYASNVIERTFPRGLDVEVFSFDCLTRLNQLAKTAADREHVTSYIHNHLKEFKLVSVTHKQDESKYRWTVDTSEDFCLIKTLLEAIYPENPTFTFEDLLALIKRNPEWQKINEHIKQKEL